ncbi:MAG: hypothetical protein IKW46_01035 [Bacteroidaceae bacterium]|nr:hypothetical protein [Bacteroidaceae bacterium]
MKKNYFTPTTMEIKIIGPSMCITSGETTGSETGSGNVGDETPEVAGKHRGEWGNLW